MSRKMRDLRVTYMSLYDFITSSYRLEDYVIISGHNDPYVISGLYVLNGTLIDTGNAVVPAIVIESQTTVEDPFQLGSGKKDIRHFNVDVYARSDGERDDIGELLRYFLRQSVPIYDYNILVSGGGYVTLAHGVPENIVMIISRFDPKIKHLRHTMRVSFDLDIYINSGNTLIT